MRTPRPVDPKRTKAIGAALIKHARLDAHVPAQLGAAGLLAEVRIPTLKQRLGPMPPTARDMLVRSRTRIVNCIRGMLALEGFVLSIDGRIYDHTDPARIFFDLLAPSLHVTSPGLTTSGQREEPLVRPAEHAVRLRETGVVKRTSICQDTSEVSSPEPTETVSSEHALDPS